MNKVLHVLVYLFLILAGVALFFEMKLFDKRTLLGDRNRMMEDYIVRVARTIEKVDPQKPMSVPEAKKDISPIEAKEVESVETEDVLGEYPAQLEEANLDTFNWDGTETRLQLRQLYAVDATGEVILDAANYNKPMTKGKGTMQELLEQLFDRAKNQQAKLNTTRSELVAAREKIEKLVADFNKLPPEMRQDKITIEQLKAKIAQLEQEKAALEEQVSKLKQQIEDLNAEIASLKDEVSAAKDETEAVKEDLAKAEKLVEQLKRLLQQQAQQQAAAQAVGTGGGGGGAAVTSLTVGKKGEIVDVNNELMFCVVKFDEASIKELLGPERQNAMAQLEMGVRRKGLQGGAGEFVGKIRLRQAVAGKNYAIADVLGDWKQVDIEKGDSVYAE